MSIATRPLVIEPTAVYTDGDLVLGLNLTHATLARARRDGGLRYTRKGKRVLYLGRWLLAWLERAEDRNSRTVQNDSPPAVPCPCPPRAPAQ